MLMMAQLWGLWDFKKNIFKPNGKKFHKLFLDFGNVNIGQKARLIQRDIMQNYSIDLNLTPMVIGRQILNISNKLDL